MSLWTPGGEVPMDRRGSAPADDAVEVPEGFDLDSLSPEERAQAEAFIAQMAETQRRIAATPAAALVANHAVGLYDLAAIKLSDQPPQLDEARLAVDALEALVERIGDRLGEDAGPLREALTTIQLAWVQVRDATGGSAAPEG